MLPLLYPHGLSSGDFVPALGQFLGSAKGLSPAVITKLTEQWKTDQRTFAERDLSEVDFVYLWADGIHVNIEQRRWFHKTANALAALPKSAHRVRRRPSPRSGTPRTSNTPSARQEVRGRLRGQVRQAVAKITDDLDELLTFYDYPAEHWVHLRTTNLSNPPSPPSGSAYESPRAPVPAPPASRFAFQLVESAQARQRAVNAPHLVALVCAGARFENGQLVERPDESGGDQQAA